MPNVTIAVPEEMHREMKRHSTVKWPEVMRQAIARELELLHVFDKVFAESTMTEDDAIELGREVRAAMAKRNRDG